MKVSDVALRIIDQHGRAEGNLFYIEKMLDRREYVAVNDVLVALGGQWSRKQKCHVFPDGFSVDDALADVLSTGQVLHLQKDLEVYETPTPLAARLVMLAQIEPGHHCLEPSAGRGRIAEVMAVACGSKSMVTVVDVHPPFIAGLMRNGFEDAHVANFLEWPWSYLEGDYDPGRFRFDRIVMNPPFARQADIDHVTHASRFLADHGVLVAVMSGGVAFRENKKTLDFWRRLRQQGSVEVIELPPATFSESGTQVNTVILTFHKGV